MKKILSLVVSLTVISGVCAAVLAYVNEITKGPIAEMKVKKEQSAQEIVEDLMRECEALLSGAGDRVE